MSDLGYPFARLAMSIVFIVASVGMFMNVSGVANSLAARGFPMTTTLGYAVAAVQLAAAVLLLVGYRARWAVLVLIVFTAATIIVSHNFWDMDGVQRALNQTQALKNLAIMGGLLLFVLMGAGRYSLDGADR